MSRPALWRSALLPLLFAMLTASQAQTSLPQPPAFDRAKEAFLAGDLSAAQLDFERLATQGSVEAHYYLALIAQRSDPTAAHKAAIVQHLTIAAEGGVALAMRALGFALENGEGVAPAPLRAMDWYRQADRAEPFGPAQVQFLRQTDGQLTEDTYRRLLEQMMQAAHTGAPETQYRLAKLLDLQYGVSANETRALHWYAEAARNGHAYSRYLLGYFYCRGIGVQPDTEAANRWLAESGRSARCHSSEEEH